MNGDDDLVHKNGTEVKHLPPGDVARVQILKIKLVHNITRVFNDQLPVCLLAQLVRAQSLVPRRTGFDYWQA